MGQKFYYVYVLFSNKDKKFYVGYSQDLRARIKDHLQGRVESTKNRRPIQLIHYEAFLDNDDARSRERFLKSGFGRSQMKKAIQRTLAKLG